MPVRPLLASALAAGLLAAASPARAADLDYGYGDAPPPPAAEEKVEFGSGWYIRGDIGATKLPSLQLVQPTNLPTATNFSSPSPATPLLTNGHNVGYVASLGGGYQFNNWFRADLLVDFHQPLATSASTTAASVFCPTGVSYTQTTDPVTGAVTYSNPVYANGGCTGNFTARVQSYDALVNGYLDLGNWNRITPYIGAGVGVSFGHYNASASYIQANNNPYQNISFFDPKYQTTFTYNYNRSTGGSYQTFAYALMAGVAIDVFDHTKLDVGYRYLNLGSIPGVSGNLSEHEVRAGVRYMVDN